MTAQLSRKCIEQYANDPRMCNVNEEIRTMARMLLAGMSNEPVAVAGFDAATAIRACMEEFPDHVHDIVEECAQIAENTISTRHAAPPAPVAVPDERAAFESFMAERFGDCIDRRRVKNGDGEYMAWDMQVAWIVWRRRASTLKGGPVTGWIKCGERMPADRDSVLIWDADLDDALSGHYSHQTGNFYQAGMVVDNEVTHWMPLPAAPEQEV